MLELWHTIKELKHTLLAGRDGGLLRPRIHTQVNLRFAQTVEPGNPSCSIAWKKLPLRVPRGGRQSLDDVIKEEKQYVNVGDGTVTACEETADID